MRTVVLWLVLAASMQAQKLDGSTRADWPHYGGTQAAWRYSALDQINVSNVRRLAPAWIFQTGDAADGLQSTPLVIDGVMYVITPHTQVFALDAATPRRRTWRWRWR
ncbi:MAG TPA: PQQ-binding-like beta-propeller repeat protein [Bryobacteraceae bacterium]|nr:PQQ-binding-like beta-propeller repeat protein [Bryobacteraceae bacterium]